VADNAADVAALRELHTQQAACWPFQEGNKMAGSA